MKSSTSLLVVAQLLLQQKLAETQVPIGLYAGLGPASIHSPLAAHGVNCMCRAGLSHQALVEAKQAFLVMKHKLLVGAHK
jgi:hypothetical protein